ncbi:asparagine synthase (glutamine-hydrolyzing) [Pseudomonas sp. Sample_10]|uniref:asparagine synthase (glutamine-hydrolyzing) n=1 Tax=Pseudomonas sp. Sample_10 TaxID=2448269 RepID=UPI001035E0A9|nr:asparagine synthase (glutamine-hydrolyzing) [Pseudomonas sp. Sample_10]
MCGLFGAVIYNKSTNRQQLLARIEEAQSVQAHRGPDMNGHKVYELNDVTVVLAHQRLSILDLSDNGRQPMSSSNLESEIVFNGEVYNYKEIALAKKMNNLRSGTDTEVILEALSGGNYAEALAEFNGMWSIALLDTNKQTLLLSRDRAGVKPLYHTVVDGNLYFASEIKTLLVLSGGKFNLNLGVVGKYIEQSVQDDTTATFFEGINSLESGEYAVLDLKKKEINISSSSYWTPFSAFDKSYYQNPEAKFRELFEDAVKLRLRADVPVGVTLSGGLDSSLICQAVRSQLGHSNFFVLSAVSPGKKGDESPFIDIVADHFDLDVSKVDLGWSADETLALMHKATWHNDAPLGSLSNVAFYLLMSQARELGVKVILSGQGADEILCGYKKYLGFYIKHLVKDRKYFTALKVLLSFARTGTVLNQFGFAEAKRYLEGKGVSSTTIMSEKVISHFKKAPIGAIGRSLEDRQWLDYKKYSVPYLTHYEDRMSMAFGREIRLPFLDYRLVEFMLNAPANLKLCKGWTKYLLRTAYEALLPKSITWRKDKQGFTSPQDEWLRAELKSAVESYFSSSALIYKYDLIDRVKLEEKYAAYCSGDRNVWYREIFNPLGLEVWLREFQAFIRTE